MSDRPILELAGVKRTFGTRGRLLRRRGGIQAVRRVDLTVARGETVGIVGESGCGKSTLARMIVGLDLPSEGSIRLDGESVPELTRHNSAALWRRIQYVFQDPLSSLNPRKTVRQILAAPLIHLLGMDAPRRRERIDELMGLVNLRPEFIDRYPHEFSGGQSQRIGVARALAAEPEIIVLDEPVSALDVSVQAQVLNLLADLKQRLKLTYVFISHDLAVVESLCDRVAVMYLGRVVEQAERAELYGSPRHPYTRVLLSSVPIPGQRTRRRIRVEGDLPNPAAPPPGCNFAPRCYRAQPHCHKEVPPLEPLAGPQRLVACFHADDSEPNEKGI
jgi:peptide/nickel transport system ATP-binding protein